MFKKISVSSLLVLSALLPAASFAKQPAHPFLGGRVHLETRHEVKKPSTDVLVLLMGKVTVLNGTTLTLVANNGTTYTVNAASAKVVRRYEGAMTVADIQVNDQLYVQGTLVGTNVTAKSIQDFSLQARNGSFSGTVQSVSSGSFVLQSQNRGLQTILLSSTTKFLKNGSAATLADLVVGVTVNVDGVWNNTNNNVAATKVRIVVKQEQVRLNGTVSTLSGTTLMLAGSDGKTYSVNVSAAQLATRSYYGNDWTHMHTGDAVQVWGKTMTGSTDVKASIVVDFSAS